MSELQKIFSNIGFMQGRLSPIMNGRIQSFPWDNWKEEFHIANSLGLRKMEWTLDQENLHQNPLMTSQGRKEVKRLINDFDFFIPSLTGDCFMQSPFWKCHENTRIELENDFLSIIDSCSSLKIKIIVVPLVDEGSIENNYQLDTLLHFLNNIIDKLRESSIQILFESDYEPNKFKEFIDELDKDYFGVNYDIGNSASLGFKPEEEFLAYGERILNVHVKDRVLGGTTVPLGQGNADFHLVFNLLKDYSYQGNYIMQTARGKPDEHSIVLDAYKRQIESWLSEIY